MSTDIFLELQDVVSRGHADPDIYTSIVMHMECIESVNDSPRSSRPAAIAEVHEDFMSFIKKSISCGATADEDLVSLYSEAITAFGDLGRQARIRGEVDLQEAFARVAIEILNSLPKPPKALPPGKKENE